MGFGGLKACSTPVFRHSIPVGCEPPARYASIEYSPKSMATQGFKLRRDLRALNRRAREWRMILKGLASTDHPVMAHIIPIRRCNLSCAYCNEYDDYSKPVPVPVMLERIER